MSFNLFGTTPAVNNTSFRLEDTSKALSDIEAIPIYPFPSTSELIKAYLVENGERWCAREYTRIKSSLGFLPQDVISRQIAIDLKASIQGGYLA